MAHAVVHLEVHVASSCLKLIVRLDTKVKLDSCIRVSVALQDGYGLVGLADYGRLLPKWQVCAQAWCSRQV